MISSLLVLVIVLLLQHLWVQARIFSTSPIDSLKFWLHSCMCGQLFSWSVGEFDGLHQGCLESPEYASLIEVAFQASAWLTHWTCPPVGWCSIILDGAFDDDHRVGRIGVVARDRS